MQNYKEQKFMEDNLMAKVFYKKSIKAEATLPFNDRKIQLRCTNLM